MRFEGYGASRGWAQFGQSAIVKVSDHELGRFTWRCSRIITWGFLARGTACVPSSIVVADLRVHYKFMKCCFHAHNTFSFECCARHIEM